LGATGARLAATRAFLTGFGLSEPVAWAALVFWAIDSVIFHSPFTAITAVMTWITLIAHRSKQILPERNGAMEWQPRKQFR